MFFQFYNPSFNQLLKSFHPLKPLEKDNIQLNDLPKNLLFKSNRSIITKPYSLDLDESEYEDCQSHISDIDIDNINLNYNDLNNQNTINFENENIYKGKYNVITSPNNIIQIPSNYYTNDENEIKFINLLNEDHEIGNIYGWEKIIEDDVVTVYMKKVLLDDEYKTPSCILKTFAKFPFHINQLSSFMEDFEFRSRFEVMLSKGHIIEKRHKVENYEIEYDYFYLSFPWPLSDRDFVEEKKSFHDYAGVKNTKVFLLKSTTHPLEPERKGIIRANLIMNGTYLKKINENLTDFKSIVQLDIKINSSLAMKLMFSQAPKGQRDWVHETIKKLPEFIEEKGLYMY